MSKNVLLILLNHRKDCATTVQKLLTTWGCLIKTRLGLHEGVLENCSETGFMFLELVGENNKHEELTRKINLISGVTAKLVTLNIDE